MECSEIAVLPNGLERVDGIHFPQCSVVVVFEIKLSEGTFVRVVIRDLQQ